MAKEKNEKKIVVKGYLLNQILAKLGIKAENETETTSAEGIDNAEGSADTAKSMELETSDGETINVEREEGDPQVGDKASPDGTFEMPDGKTITIKDGEITNIETGSGDDGEGAAEDNDTEGSADTDTVAQLRKQVNSLTTERDELKAQLQTAQKNAKTKEERRILNAVKMAGGAEKVLGGISSNYQPEQRTPQGKNAADKADEATRIKDGANAILAQINGKKPEEGKK